MTRRTILVVDDDAHILEVLHMRLEAMGFEPTCCQNPEDAVGRLAERGFDLALFDLRMEALDGVALMQRAHELQARLPVLIMTAHGTIRSAVDAIKQGAFDFLTKPFVPEELSTKIGRALAERRWARDLALLRTVSDTLASARSADRVLDLVARTTMDATETEQALIVVRQADVMRTRTAVGASPVPPERIEELAARVVRTRPTATLVDDVGGRRLLAAPLVVDGETVGALVAVNPSYVVPTDEDRSLLGLLASHAAVALRTTTELGRLRSGALEALGRVATQVAHEINNPLGGLKLYAHILEDRFAKLNDKQGAEYAGRIGRAVDRLADIVKDITAYGRPPELRREPTLLNALVEECLGLVQDRVAEKRIQVSADLDARLGPMSLDARELQRVLLNLIVNALDALETAGTLRVSTRATTPDVVEITIEDTGCGMDSDTMARMYELFYTTKPNGTGLGMAIARSIVERHGGRLEVASQRGEGTRCRITVPIRTV